MTVCSRVIHRQCQVKWTQEDSRCWLTLFSPPAWIEDKSPTGLAKEPHHRSRAYQQGVTIHKLLTIVFCEETGLWLLKTLYFLEGGMLIWVSCWWLTGHEGWSLMASNGIQGSCPWSLRGGRNGLVGAHLYEASCKYIGVPEQMAYRGRNDRNALTTVGIISKWHMPSFCPTFWPLRRVVFFSVGWNITSLRQVLQTADACACMSICCCWICWEVCWYFCCDALSKKVGRPIPAVRQRQSTRTNVHAWLFLTDCTPWASETLKLFMFSSQKHRRS